MLLRPRALFARSAGWTWRVELSGSYPEQPLESLYGREVDDIGKVDHLNERAASDLEVVRMIRLRFDRHTVRCKHVYDDPSSLGAPTVHEEPRGSLSSSFEELDLEREAVS